MVLAADVMAPLLPHEARLVSVEDLVKHLTDPRWVVIDTRYRLADPEWGPRVYLEGHLPGAFYAHLERDLSDPPRPSLGRHPLPEIGRFSTFLARCGVGPDSIIVAYDEASLPGPFRLWWLALRWELPQVFVLDGGIRAWCAANLPLEVGTVPPFSSHSPLTPRAREGLEVSTAEIEDWIRQGQGILVDARERRRYLGLAEPIDPVAGHIPRARNLPYTATIDDHGKLLPPESLRRLAEHVVGGRPSQPVAHACGSGVTACQTLFAMTRAGFAGGRLYAGSYSAWIAEPRHAVVTGPEDGLGDERAFENRAI